MLEFTAMPEGRLLVERDLIVAAGSRRASSVQGK